MRESFYFFNIKTILKYIIILLLLLIGGLILALDSYKKTTPLKLKTKNNSVEIKRLTDIADNFYFETERKDSAYIYYNKAQLICEPKIDYTDYVYAISSMAEIQHIQGDYIGSEANLTKTLPYLKKIKKTRYAWFVYNVQGLNYHNLSDYNNALIYLKKALKLKTPVYRKSFALNNIAIVYMSQNKYKEAINLFHKLIKHPKISKYDYVNDYQYALLLDNLGYCYFKTGNHKALDCYQKSLKIRLRTKKDYLISISYYHFSKYYQKTNLLLAKKYAKLGYENALEFNNTTNKINCLSQLIGSSNGNELKKYSLMYIKLIDSVNKSTQTAQNQFTNIKYNAKLDNQENLQLKVQKAENELELEKQKKRNIILYVVILLTLGLLTFLYFYLTYKGTKEKKEAISKSEIRISRKLHDELANDIYQTLTFAKNKDLELHGNKDQLLKNLDVIYSKTRDISKENSNISTDKNYPLAVKEMILGHKSPEINILINGFDTIHWNEIEKNKKIILYRILQELFVNMKNHSEASLASISFNIKNKNLQVIYIDNGVGIKNNTLILKNGLQNVESRIKTINGTIIFGNNSQKGFKISFTFPL
jgi:hypothetical protein